MRERSGRQDVPERSGPKGWRVVLAQRTPPMRAAAKRRSQAELGCGVGPRGEVYGALAGAAHSAVPRHRVEWREVSKRVSVWDAADGIGR